MREYEAMLVLSPELDDEGVDREVTSVGELVEREGGELLSTGQLANKKGQVAEVTEGWKARKLAYAIRGHTEGFYVVMRFNTGSQVPDELERVWKLNENVLRYMVLRADEHQE